MPQGRVDPFGDPRPPAPTPPPASKTDAAGALSPGSVPAGGLASKAGVPGLKSASAHPVQAVPAFQITGVVQSGGRPEAIVEMGNQSDSLRIGQQGSTTTPLLPPGWSVETININACSLVLKKGGLLHTYRCADS